MLPAALLGFLVFCVSLATFWLTIPEKIAAFGIFGAVRASFYFGLLAGSIVYAWRRGGGPERAVAAVLVLVSVIDPLMHLALRPRFASVDPTHLILDTAELVAFVVIAIRADRLWTLWLCAFHGLAVLAHLAKIVNVTIHPVIYGVMEVMWSYPLLLLLIYGTWNHQRRSKTARAATSSSASSPAMSPPAIMPPTA